MFYFTNRMFLSRMLFTMGLIFFMLQYLKQGSITDPNLDDASDYRRMDESMNKVGFSGEEKANIFRVVAAVLHVGNISFEDSGDTEGIIYHIFFICKCNRKLMRCCDCKVVSPIGPVSKITLWMICIMIVNTRLDELSSLGNFPF